MIDFTSSLYLGLHHSSASLPGWRALTLGLPAALRDPPGASELAVTLAGFQGCEAAALMPSTLHLYWDLFHMLARGDAAILRDARAYAISRWGAERASAGGIPLHTFSHYDSEALAQLVDQTTASGLKPIVVADGYCPGCSRRAPVATYSRIVREAGGYLVLDDTQAVGIIGEHGGGSLRANGVSGPHVILGSSLAKGLGTPLAVLGGSREIIERFRRASETRVHCSPPSVAVIAAGRRALLINSRIGDRLRRRLTRLVIRLRNLMKQNGLLPLGRDAFPVQSFRSARGLPVTALYERLLHMGVAGLLRRACDAVTACLTFVVTVRHTNDEIEQAARAVASASRSLARAS